MNQEEFEKVCDQAIENIEKTAGKKMPLSLLLAVAIFRVELIDVLFSDSDEIMIEPNKEV